MTNAAEIGRNIVLLRKAKNISQEQLALRAEMSVSFLRDIEHELQAWIVLSGWRIY